MKREKHCFLPAWFVLVMLGLLLAVLPGCASGEEKKAVEVTQAYFEGYRDLDTKKIKQTADASLIDTGLSEKKLKKELEKRQEAYGWVQRWYITDVTVDTVNGQSLQTVYVLTSAGTMKAIIDLRKEDSGRWRVIYVKVEDKVNWGDWPKSLGRLVLGHSTNPIYH